MDVIANTVKGYEWEIIILLVFIFSIAVAKAYYTKRFIQVLKSIPLGRFAAQVIREEKVYTQRGQFLLQFSFFIIAPLFLIYLSHYIFDIAFTEVTILDYLIFFGCILIAYFIKTLVHLALSKFFNAMDIFREYIFNVFSINAGLGLLFAVILISQLFITNHNATIYNIAIILTCALFLFRLVRSGYLIVSKNYPLFYGFLYLCTLEILPLVVIFKILSSYLA